jgi:nicotinamidase-related amidase
MDKENLGLLHKWTIDEAQYKRHEARRGRRHAFEQLDPLRTAVIVVDMVPFFVESNPYALGIVDNICLLTETVRKAKGCVAWVVPQTTAPTQLQERFYGPEVARSYAASGGTGTIVERLWPAFIPDSSDLLVEKNGHSAFFPGNSSLHQVLQKRDITSVLIVGTVANVCCESTARDAVALGYQMTMVADANAAIRDEDLNATLHTIYRSFGDVRTTDELIAVIAKTPMRPSELPPLMER